MQFNIRIYALLIHKDKLLLLKEPFAGKKVTKFPGGGLEFGEGTIDCLKREFKEELNLEVEVTSHFYTSENFIPHSLREDQQLFFVYYKVKALDIENLNIIDKDIEEVIWKPLSELKETDMSLATDKIVVKKLLIETL